LQLFRTGSAAPAGPAAQTRSSVQIRGDAEIANLYRDLFTAARPDLEEELSRWVGDMPARHLSQLAKSVRTWARRARRTAGENIAEYLQEEGRDLITKTEMEEFLRGVDGVRDGVDRIEARLRGIEQRMKGA
jgi:ubiquinone biosynthesis protein UbiJ